MVVGFITFFLSLALPPTPADEGCRMSILYRSSSIRRCRLDHNHRAINNFIPGGRQYVAFVVVVVVVVVLVLHISCDIPLAANSLCGGSGG